VISLVALRGPIGFGEAPYADRVPTSKPAVGEGFERLGM